MEQTASMGEMLFVEGFGYRANCIVPQFSHSESFALMAGVATIKADQPLCEQSAKGYYYPDYENVFITTEKYKNPVTVEDSGDETKFCVGVTCFSKPKASYRLEENKFRFKADSLRQQIEYMGKSGEVLEFTYSEFKDDMARSAFTRTFKVDLNEGSILNFKGAKVEIIEATNSGIKYKIINGFN